MKLRTVNEAAKALGVSPARLRRGVASGKYPSMRWGSRVLLDLDEVTAIIEEERKREAAEGTVGLQACAVAIGVSPDALRRMALAGLVPFARAGRYYRFRISEVEAAIRKIMK